MKNIFTLSLIGLLLIGCSSVPVPITTPLASPSTNTAGAVAATPEFKQGPMPSPTGIQLPFNPNVGSDEYCSQSLNAFLPLSESTGLSEDEIAHELVKTWLEKYNQPTTHPFCRIDGYTIDKVYDDPGMYSNVLEPRGDFMRVIAFSVKLIQVPTAWMSLAGELDQHNWLHSGHIVAITKTSEGYQLEFANP